ncbi:MAG: NUDIX domain-containing protein [Tetrasphaera sp.]|nr:NUDIX domain-containing protein [Tetrasphaera sp.]
MPGGTVEPGESELHALARELREELGVDIETARPRISTGWPRGPGASRGSSAPGSSGSGAGLPATSLPASTWPSAGSTRRTCPSPRTH